MIEWSPVARVFVFGAVTALATGLGALPFLFLHALEPRTVARMHALAAGLMLGASAGLVQEGSAYGIVSSLVGAAIGALFIVAGKGLLGEREVTFAGQRGAGARRTLLLVAVMTLHSFAEGVAVGVAFGGGAVLATTITVAIALHNVPEGLAISAVMRPKGASVAACAGWSVFSSLPQPIMAVPAFLFVETFREMLPYGLGFAAGAMVLMVFRELLPEAFALTERGTVVRWTVFALVGMILFQTLL